MIIIHRTGDLRLVVADAKYDRRLKETGVPALDLVAYPKTKRRESWDHCPVNRGESSNP